MNNMDPHLFVKTWNLGSSKPRKLVNFITYLEKSLKVKHNIAQIQDIKRPGCSYGPGPVTQNSEVMVLQG